MLKADSHAFPDDGEYERWSRSSPLMGSLRWDAHGYLAEDLEDERLIYRLRLYRNGVFEWANCMVDRAEMIPSLSLAEYVHDVLGYFASCYRRAGYFGRIRIWISLEDAEDTKLGVNPDFSFRLRPLTVPRFEWQGDDNVDALAQNLTAVTRAAMDRVWVAYGSTGCPYFDDNGEPREDRWR
jgi:hypothetical protein